MGDTVAGSRRRYFRLIAQPRLWLLIIMFMLFIDIGGAGIPLCLYYFVADRHLLASTQNTTASTALGRQQIPSSVARLSEPVGTQLGALQDANSTNIRLDTVRAQRAISQVHWDIPSTLTLPRIYANAQDVTIVSLRSPVRTFSLYATRWVPDLRWRTLVVHRLNEALPKILGLLSAGMMVIFFFVLVVAVVLVIVFQKLIHPLRRLLSHAQEIMRGELHNPRHHETGTDEIVQLDRVLYDLADQIQQYRASDQTHRSRVISVLEAERRQLSLMLHDETMQGLVAVGQRLQLAQKALERGDQAAIAATITNARVVNQTVMDELRRRISTLHPANLEGEGLLTALEALLRDIGALGIEVNLVVDGQVLDLGNDIELTAFRIAQEAILNIIKHARAKHVTMTIGYTQAAFCLQVQDDGIGFTVTELTAQNAGVDLAGVGGMKERVDAVGGEFMITSQPGQGTLVKTLLPYRPGQSKSVTPESDSSD